MFAQQTFVVFQQPVSTSPAVRREKLDYLMLSPFTFRSVPLKNLIGKVFKLLCTPWLSAFLYKNILALSNQPLKVVEKCGQSLKYLLAVKTARVAYLPGLKPLDFPLSGLFL